MVSTIAQPRQPKGAVAGNVNVGGQFAEHLRTNPEVRLGASGTAMEQLHARRMQLRAAGYMPAGSGIADGSPRSTAGISRWWETHFTRAEFAPEAEKGSYHQMPDDYTPGMHGGRALSQHRRTHRMLYEGAGVAVRMPSVTSIRRYSKELKGQTFDIPVEATYPGGTVSGYVRVTQNGPNTWSVSGLNMPAAANAYVSEAIQATLEDRRPSTALGRVEDLLERRRERFAAGGVTLNATPQSSWIRGMGYNDASQQMVVQLGERVYAYKVQKEIFEAAQTSWSPGRIYNQLVKGRDRAPVDFHDVCGRYFDAAKPHRCPSRHKDRSTTVKLFNRRVRDHVLARTPAVEAPRPMSA